jgi:formamidopyrimidine-DNA glycosylase
MPELPEVQTTVNNLKPKALNRAFVGVWSDWKKTIKKPANFFEFEKQIKNKKIKNVWRRAKNIIFDLTDGYSLLVHQKMTGHLLFGEWVLKNGKWQAKGNGFLADKINGFIHVMFFFDNGKMLALSDARKFAKIELQKTEELKKEFKKLGPEPLNKNFTFEKFSQILKNKNSKIKQVLMDQSVVAGIGNIYASEALWMAKIHPESKASSVNAEKLRDLYQSIKKVLELSIKLGGESFSDYRKPDGSEGGYDSKRKVYRREGQNCNRCGYAIKKMKIGQRGTFYCPNCQKLK